jgi:hypothetical protein
LPLRGQLTDLITYVALPYQCAPLSVFDQHGHQRFALVNLIVLIVCKINTAILSKSFLMLYLLNWSVGDGMLCWRCIVDWGNGLFNLTLDGAADLFISVDQRDARLEPK